MINSLLKFKTEILSEWQFIFSFVILLFLSASLPFNNVQFVIWSLFPLLYFKGNIRLDSKDLSLIAYSFLVLISYFWATNQSAVWERFFILIACLNTYIFIKNYEFKTTHLKYLRIGLSHLFIILLLQHLLGLYFVEAPTTANWQKYLFCNNNVSASYLCIFFPFLFFLKFSPNASFILKLIISFGLIIVLLLVGARGALLSILFVAIVLLIANGKRVLGLKFLVYSLLIFLAIIFFTHLSNSSLFENFINEFDKRGEFDRFYFMKFSLLTFIENPFFGVGSGNWITEVFKYPLDDTTLDGFDRVKSHNIYFKVLVENGIIGFILLFRPIYYTLHNSLKSVKSLSNFETALICILTFYFFVQLFYGGVNSYLFNYSGIDFIAFFAFGFLSGKFRNKTILTLNPSYFIFPVIICFVWFSIISFKWHNFFEYYSKESTYSNSIALERVSSVYNPYYFRNINHNTSLDLILSNLFLQNNDYSKALIQIEDLLIQDPYNLKALFCHAEILYETGLYNEALVPLEKMKIIQGSNSDMNFLFCKVYKGLMDFDKVKVHMQNVTRRKLSGNPEKYEYLNLEIASLLKSKGNSSAHRYFIKRVNPAILDSVKLSRYNDLIGN